MYFSPHTGFCMTLNEHDQWFAYTRNQPQGAERREEIRVRNNVNYSRWRERYREYLARSRYIDGDLAGVA